MLYNQRNCLKVYVLTVYINGRVIFAVVMNRLKTSVKSGGVGTVVGGRQ